MSSDGTAYQILDIGNQQAIHYAMPLRTLMYETLSYVRQVADRANELKKTKKYSNTGVFLSGWKKDDRLKPCYTIVIYWGKDRWDGPRSLADIMEFDAECKMSNKFRDYPAMHLICVNELDAHGLEGLRHEEVHEVFDKVNAIYQKDIKDLQETERKLFQGNEEQDLRS